MNQMQTLPRRTLILMIFIMFVDFVGLFMVIPLFTPLLLGKATTLLSPAASHFARTMSLGLLVSMYGLGQFFGGPMLGELSDQFGRKKGLLLGVSIFAIANALSVFALFINSLWVLFASRLIAGFSSGNASVLFAAVSDADDKQRGTRIGYLVAAAGVGTIVGPLFGVYLSHIDGNVQLCLPFLCLTVISIVNIAVILFGYRDLGHYVRRKLNLFTGVANIFDCMRYKQVGRVMLSFLFFVCGTEAIFIGLPIFCVQKFQVNSIFLGNLFAWGGLCSALSSWWLNKKLGEYFDAKVIYILGSLALFLGYITVFLPGIANEIYVPYTLITLSCVLVWTRGNDIAAGLVAESVKGKVLGVMQSMVSLGIFVAPLTVGLIAAHHYDWPIIFSSVMGMGSVLIFINKM